MNRAAKNLLKDLAAVCENPWGAHNIRVNGKVEGRANSGGIKITPRSKGDGIDVHIKPGTKGETLFIPVVLTDSGFSEVVHNNFYIGKNCEVTIAAGCGIHNDDKHLTQHDGTHTFHIGAGARVKYIETHQGRGSGSGIKSLNPKTVMNLEPNSMFEIETTQIKGVDLTDRVTIANVGDDAKLIIAEKLMTDDAEKATTRYEMNLNGRNSNVSLSSRSVAKGKSKQYFYSILNGNNSCHGHSQCDAIITDNATVEAIPNITANTTDAQLIHEAAIGKIAGEQIIKLMTLGLTRDAAEGEIIAGFLS
jgi:Fe-S cluster assembly scaffold protein SufB